MVNLPECSRPATALSNRERRIATIRAEFTRQQARGVKSSFIIADLAYRYFMTESTIQSIVWKRGRYGVCSSTANALSL